MKKLDWLKKLAHKTDLPLTVVTKVFDECKDIFIDALKTDGEIAWAGVINLKVKHVKAKKGRNPKTGEPLDIKARNKVVAKVGKHLTDAVN